MPSNTNTLHKVIYKPDSQSTDEFMVIVNKDEYSKWKEGDTSIALALVVETFDIFHTGQGSQGILGRISKQQLDTVFNTKNEDEAVKIILDKGTIQAGDPMPKGAASMNSSKGGWTVDTRGSGGSLRG